MKNKKTSVYFRAVSLAALAASLSSCSVYPTGFTCPDAAGARCVRLSAVDAMVDSGEIETVYTARGKKGKKAAEPDVPEKKSEGLLYIK